MIFEDLRLFLEESGKSANRYVFFEELAEQGSVSYACLSGQGELFRSDRPCDEWN